MHDRRDRTSWAYQLPPNLAPPIPYAEPSGVPTCPPSSSHMLSSPIAHAFIPSLHHHQHSQQRLSTNATNSTTLLPSFRCASSNRDYRDEQDCANQHQRQPQEQLPRQVPSLVSYDFSWQSSGFTVAVSSSISGLNHRSVS
jgi:hypothetical protein